MPYLLDTCAILYCASGSADLSEPMRAALSSGSPGEVFVSAVSVAEIVWQSVDGSL